VPSRGTGNLVGSSSETRFGPSAAAPRLGGTGNPAVWDMPPSPSPSPNIASHDIHPSHPFITLTLPHTSHHTASPGPHTSIPSVGACPPLPRREGGMGCGSGYKHPRP